MQKKLGQKSKKEKLREGQKRTDDLFWFGSGRPRVTIYVQAQMNPLPSASSPIFAPNFFAKILPLRQHREMKSTVARVFFRTMIDCHRIATRHDCVCADHPFILIVDFPEQTTKGYRCTVRFWLRTRRLISKSGRTNRCLPELLQESAARISSTR